jgi:putative flippase GtrA
MRGRFGGFHKGNQGKLMRATFKLTIRYAIFAGIATIANICAQEGVIQGYQGPYDLWGSIFAGTFVGLVVKYLLDKRFIFRFRPQSKAHDGKTFLLYTLMGVLTTGVFWGFEFTFNEIFHNKEMRYIGGIIGLAFGYLAKYQLDKRFVFCVKRR